jgi:1,4-dihydroxy-2-naphthoate octaprenyltransferase
MAEEPLARHIGNFVRALRLPFISVSILPFVLGSALAGEQCRLLPFLLGLTAVIATHLSANLINDYADSKSGLDWGDRKFYGFFGGSKCIQEHIFSEEFYLRTARIFAAIAGVAVLLLAITLASPFVVLCYTGIVFLAWSYSHKPLQLSYRGWGEVIIFVLFGPALVMGGYFIQTGAFPTLEGFLLSLPFGFLTTAVLFANEIPDFSDDAKASKHTWVKLVGPERAFLLYYILMSCMMFSVAVNIALGYLSLVAIAALGSVLMIAKAGSVLRQHYSDKYKLLQSSKLTVATHTVVSTLLLVDIVI